MNMDRRLDNIEKALNALGSKDTGKGSCPECGTCYCWKGYKYNECPNRNHHLRPENFRFQADEKVQPHPNYSEEHPSYLLNKRNLKEEAEAELVQAKIAEYCGACGHAGRYQLEVTFDIDAASGRPPPEWRARLKKELEEAKSKKRYAYFDRMRT